MGRWKGNPPPAERFWAQVARGSDEECWEWLGELRDGYGRFYVNGKRVPAYTYAYTLVIGPFPEGLVPDHLCRNPRCVNPFHLEPVTNTVNILRGEGLGAKAARRESCPRGHPLSGDNLEVAYHNGRAYRRCRTCDAANIREWRTARRPLRLHEAERIEASDPATLAWRFREPRVYQARREAMYGCRVCGRRITLGQWVIFIGEEFVRETGRATRDVRLHLFCYTHGRPPQASEMHQLRDAICRLHTER